MTWTYDPSLLTSTASTDANLMRVRFLVGDVSTSTQLVEDEEINWVYSVAGNVWSAAAQVARGIANHYARLASQKSIGQLSLSYQGRTEHFVKLADALKAQARDPLLRNIGAGVYAGGISVDDKQTQRDDSDWDKPFFARGQWDHPAVATPEWTLVLSST